MTNYSATAASPPPPGTLTGADIAAFMEERFPLSLAAEWDRCGWVVGDAAAPIHSILLAVDPAPAVVAEALSGKADLLLTHHPLLLRGVHRVDTATPKGRLVHELIKHDCGLYTAHTNADAARGGVSDAIANAVGLGASEPLEPSGNQVGVDPLLATGIGRIGKLPEPRSLGDIAHQLAQALPVSATGLRVAGSLDLPIRTVALCGGAGDSLLDTVAARQADLYITSDLRHHPADEFLAATATAGHPAALIDIGHWAAESLWLDSLAQEIRAHFAAHGTLEVRVSHHVTDPWSSFFPTGSRNPAERN